MQAAVPYLRITLSLMVTVCIFVGTFGSQYIMTLEDTPVFRFYFYKQTADGETVYFADLGPNAFGGCTARLNIVNAALAMGVIGCASMLAALTSAILLVKSPASPPITLVSRSSQCLASLFIALCITLASALYRGSFCDESPIKELFGLDYGFIVLILSLALMAVLNILECVWRRSNSSHSAEDGTLLYG